ncbi:MAG: class I SAM-dependent methyltransferase [Mizugakiibacter sp.]|uniref:class I SAM-dependent methyltransferase n=1 Tax=Mizugakiibacter sp. TaxID=1972610 RepID=UPI0031C9B09D|nr:class I SAM-dependent methyltransferase [Xanthomonadaceae bacterium]
MANQVAQGLLSPWLQRHRLAAVKPWLRGKILDFGCGAGVLADFIPPSKYIGYDIDTASVSAARSLHPDHTFVSVPPITADFDCIVSLAVIEHSDDPRAFLERIGSLVKEGGRIVVTTPNPLLDPIHHAGAKIGIFSHDASEEHVSLLNRKALMQLAASLGLSVERYERFLLGANQLLVLRK